MSAVGTATKHTAAAAPQSRRAARYQQRRARARRKLLGAIGGVTLLVVIGLAVIANRGDGPGAPPFAGHTAEVELGEFFIRGQLTAPAGPIRLHASNIGGIRHNVGVRGGPISGDALPSRDLTLDIGTLAAGTYELYCDIPEHAQQGMVANLVVTDPAATTSVAAAG